MAIDDNKLNENEYDSSIYTDLKDSILDSKDNKFVYTNINTKINFKGELIIIDESILNKYSTIIMDNTIQIEIDEKYFLQPELLSKKIYGTVDLWYLILWVNKLSSMYEFKKKYIRIFNPSEINVLNDLIELEREYIQNTQTNPVMIEDLTIMKVPISE